MQRVSLCEQLVEGLPERAQLCPLRSPCANRGRRISKSTLGRWVAVSLCEQGDSLVAERFRGCGARPGRPGLKDIVWAAAIDDCTYALCIRMA